MRETDARNLAGASETRPDGRDRFEGRRVLLAEDNPVNQRVAQRFLERLGCQVELAEDGLQAVAAAESKVFDLILMDVDMPEMDGAEATREIRRRGIRTPIVALTACAMDETRRICEQAGMDGFMTKPIRVDEIASLLRACGSPKMQGSNSPVPE